MNVVFRVDYSSQIGLGHLMRCLTLADALKNLGLTCYFVCREHESLDLLSQSDHSLIALKKNRSVEKKSNEDYADWLGVSWQQDADDTITAIKQLQTAWLVVDHYAIDFRWHQRLRQYVDKIIVIDDLVNRKLDCDLVIDSNYARTADDYSELVPDQARFCVGPEFVMLRAEFLQYREAAIRRRFTTEKIETILVFLGGGDPDNFTQIALEALSRLSWEKNPLVMVVLGAANPHVARIENYLTSYPLKTVLYINSANMAELIYSADIAIGASGGTTWERCCLGLPSISLSVADNQQYANQVLCEAGMISIPDAGLALSQGISTAVEKLKSNHELMHSMSKKCFKLVDGRGVDRIIQVLNDLED